MSTLCSNGRTCSAYMGKPGKIMDIMNSLWLFDILPPGILKVGTLNPTYAQAFLYDFMTLTLGLYPLPLTSDFPHTSSHFYGSLGTSYGFMYCTCTDTESLVRGLDWDWSRMEWNVD